MRLTAFLTARLDEDEHEAKMAEAGWPPKDVSGVTEDVEHHAWKPTGITPSKAFFILRYSPARALREVAAKRAIVTRYEFARQQAEVNIDVEKEAWEKIAGALERDVLALAAIYKDHDYYQPEWAD